MSANQNNESTIRYLCDEVENLDFNIRKSLGEMERNLGILPEQTIKPNILVLGILGCGKSSIINAVFKNMKRGEECEPLAEVHDVPEEEVNKALSTPSKQALESIKNSQLSSSTDNLRKSQSTHSRLSDVHDIDRTVLRSSKSSEDLAAEGKKNGTNSRPTSPTSQQSQKRDSKGVERRLSSSSKRDEKSKTPSHSKKSSFTKDSGSHLSKEERKEIGKFFQKYSTGQMNIYDSIGLTLENAEQFIENTTKFIREVHRFKLTGKDETGTNLKSLQETIHVVWFIIDSSRSLKRLHAWEKVLINTVLKDLPVIFILNKSDVSTEQERFQIIESLNRTQNNVDVINVVARSDHDEGLSRLVAKTKQVLPDVASEGFIAAQTLCTYHKEDKAFQIIKEFDKKFDHIKTKKGLTDWIMITLTRISNLWDFKEHACVMSQVLATQMTQDFKFKDTIFMLIRSKEEEKRKNHLVAFLILWNRGCRELHLKVLENLVTEISKTNEKHPDEPHLTPKEGLRKSGYVPQKNVTHHLDLINSCFKPLTSEIEHLEKELNGGHSIDELIRSEGVLYKSQSYSLTVSSKYRSHATWDNPDLISCSQPVDSDEISEVEDSDEE